MRKVKPYLDYSDFGQEWLGELPSHWKVIRTKLLFDLVSEPAPVGNSEELLSVYTALGVKPRKELEARGNKASSTDNYWRVEQGDIIVNKLLAWMGAIGISEYKGVTSPAYDILRHKENVNPYFYNYLFRNPIASREFKRHSRGIMDMRLRLYFSRFGDIKLPYPSLDEQNKIVDYLQFKLKKIDRFIRKKKQLIKLLNEQKAAIINQAVTKGLDPNVKMKPSGIEWLGDIPEHWEVKKLKYLVSKTGSGVTPKGGAEVYQKHGIPFLRSQNVHFDGLRLDDVAFITEEVHNSMSNTALIPRDVVLNITGASLGRCCSIPDDFIEGNVNQHVCIIRPKNEVQSIFLSSILSSSYLQKIIQLEQVGASREGLNQAEIRNLPIIVPPVSDQNEIIVYVDKESNTINKTISTIEKEITLTQEYKTTLIAEVVTGKIDVRDFEIPESPNEDLDSYREEDLEEDLSLVAEGEAEFQNEAMEE